MVSWKKNAGNHFLTVVPKKWLVNSVTVGYMRFMATLKTELSIRWAGLIKPYRFKLSTV